METPNERPRKKGDKTKGDKSAADKAKATKQFGKKDYNLICDWLEDQGNLESILGTEGKTKVGSRFPTKKQAFESLASHINDNQLKGSTLVKIDGPGARNRSILLERKYKTAKPIVDSTGWGLTEADEANGVLIVEDKRNSLCPCYDRLDAIFGGNPNVNFKENTYNSQPIPNNPDYMPWTEKFSDLLSGWNVDEGTESLVEGIHPVELGVETEMSTDQQNENVQPPAEGNPSQTHVLAADGHPRDSPTDGGDATPGPHAQSTRLEVDNTPVDPIAANGPGENGDSPSTQSVLHERGSANSAQRRQPGEKASVSSTKKRPLDKGQSITGSFAIGLEAIFDGKKRSNELKEKGQELHFAAVEANRTLRAMTSKNQLDFQLANAERLHEVQVQKLKIQEKRIAADASRDLMHAQVQIINCSGACSTAEIAALFGLLGRSEGQNSAGTGEEQ